MRLLLLPTGQVLETDSSTDVEIYTPTARPIKSIVRHPSVPTTLTHGSTYTLDGRKLNGATQDNFYGDDDQQATNFPLVQITNDSTGDVFYARTHNFSAMPVASNALVATQFDVPAGSNSARARSSWSPTASRRPESRDGPVTSGHPSERPRRRRGRFRFLGPASGG